MDIDFKSIISRINRLHIIHRFYIHKTAGQTNLFYGQPPILMYVLENDRCTQNELARDMNVSPPSIATSVRRLQKAGMLQKAEDETDKRCVRLSITDKGKKLIQDWRRLCDKIDMQMFQGFNEEECAAFSGYLDRLINNLTTEAIQNKTNFALHAEDKRLKLKRKE